MKKLTIKDITLIGIMAAAVYVASAFLQIPIPTAIGSTRLHMGNVICLLSGMFLGASRGGFAAGIGSMFFDLTNPAFLFKFIMAWLCGKIISNYSSIGLKTKFIIGATTGSFVYVFLYISKSFIKDHYILNLPLKAVILTVTQKVIISSVNAIISIIVAVFLGIILYPSVKKFLFKKI